MRVVVLTGSRHGTASACLPLLAQHPRIDVALIVLNEGVELNRWKQVKRTLRKVRQIGLLGACIGYRMRGWYRGGPGDDLRALAERYRIPVETTPAINHERTRRLFRESGAELGLSLGNGYIPSSVFEIPPLGMINVHGEILPRFQGAASVIWPIHEGICETGFTIHRIDRGIDTGPILYQERMPITLRPSLRETVRVNVATISRRVPPAVALVVADFPGYADAAVHQSGGTRYTTPTFRQYMRMLRRHRDMLRAAGW